MTGNPFAHRVGVCGVHCEACAWHLDQVRSIETETLRRQRDEARARVRELEDVLGKIEALVDIARAALKRAEGFP